MAAGSREQQQLVRELLNAVRTSSFRGNPNLSARIIDFAERVRRRLMDVEALVELRSLDFRNVSIQTIEEFITKLESTMNDRRNARFGGLLGNLARIAGTWFYASPYGPAAFWTGFVISSISDGIAAERGTEVERLSSRIRDFLVEDRGAFQMLAGTLQQLNNIIQEATGWSIYDAEFQEFLRCAAQTPNRITECIPDNASVEVRNTIIDLVQNRTLIDLLQAVYNGIQGENLLVLNIVMGACNGIGYACNSTLTGTGFQLCELSLRGLVMFVEYRKNERTLEEFRDGVRRLRRENMALEILLNNE